MNYPMQYCVAGCKPRNDGGMFEVPFEGNKIKVIASHGGDWEHVSVSLKNRTPNWREMCMIKDMFFNEEDCVIQYHPPKSMYVNIHQYVLHMWKPLKVEIPMPPMAFV